MASTVHSRGHWTFFIFLAILSSCFCQLITSIPLMSVGHIATGGDRVFASAGSMLYRYSTDLLQQQSDSLDNNVHGLATTPDGQWVVVCLSNDNCNVLNGSDITGPTIQNIDDAFGVDENQNPDSPTILTVSVSGELSFYTGSVGEINNANDRIRYGQYGFGGNMFAGRKSVSTFPNDFDRTYFGGFSLQENVYFVVTDISDPIRELRIVRICINESVTSQYELKLQCGTSNLISTTVVTGVSVINNETLVIGVTNGQGNRLCTFNISEINSLMDEVFTSCVIDETGMTNVGWLSDTCMSTEFIANPTQCIFAEFAESEPKGIAPSTAFSSPNILSNTTVNNGLRDSIGVTIDNVDLIFVGYTANSMYYLNKYHWTNNTLELIEEILISSTNVELDDEVSTVVSEDNKYLFSIIPDKIVSVAIENCSRASSCDECVSLGDPVCGWCVFESKCSRSSLCMDSESSGRYLLQGQENSCIDRFTIEPSNFVQDLEESPYEVSVTISPSLTGSLLPGEKLFCVFTDYSTNVQVKSVLSNGVCNVAEVLNKLTDISLTTEFSLFSNHTGEKFFISESPYVFYHCASQSTCSECVVAAGVCGWCLLDFECRGDNSTCTEGPNNWLSIDSDESYTDVCPLLVANDGDVNDYTQPVNVPKSLLLRTLNTPNISGLEYECVLGTVEIPATYISDTSVRCDIGGNGIQSNTDRDTQDFILRQTYSMNDPYKLETNASLDVNVVLYNCPLLARSCSQCLGQNINTGFNCGWCSNNGQCEAAASQCISGLIKESGDCGTPMVTSLSPATGPPGGQTNITIKGTNLGVVFSDIVSITVGTRTCNSIESMYSSGVRIVCTLGDGRNEIGQITVSISISTSDGNREAVGQTAFTVLEPTIESISPTIGPVSGGTLVTVGGTNFDVGNTDSTRVIFREASNRRRKRQSCPEMECVIDSVNSTIISCVSGGGSIGCIMEVVVSIDGDEYSNENMRFEYTPDPEFISVSPQEVIPAGGIQVMFTGSYLNVTQSPVILINDSRFVSTQGVCFSASGSSLECTFPNLTAVSSLSDTVDSIISYTVIVDGARGPDSTSANLQLTLRNDPSLIEVINREISLPVINSEINIRIRGSNLLGSLRSEINITVGDYNCPVNTIDTSELSCLPPNITNSVELFVMVRIGDNLRFGEDTNQWRVSFISSASSFPIGPVVGGVGGGVFVILILFIIVVIGITILARRNAKKKDMRFIKLMNDMERMEIEMAVTCKTAFTELQTDLGELVTEEALETQQLPFHSFPTYATKLFFPNVGSNHPVLCPPKVPESMSEEEFRTLLDEFRSLLLDKGFLSTFIKSLEAQPSMTVHEKSTIASLLMVSCLKDIDYATEILQVLLGDLIKRNLSQSRNHPKILLRRTESVAEKLLTNWFCVTLYPHLLETVGPALFVLFKAVKAQLEKGPIDVVTGDAKNSLSEEKLLRQALECKVLECEVDMQNANYLLSKMKKQPPAGLEPVPNDGNEIQTVKLLDTDSISQTKEKLLDFLYRHRPVSQRPSITEVELELCRGNVGIPLRDQDSTSKKDGEWTRINTLGHYDIPTMAEAAIEDPKKPTPRFRLKYKSDRPVSGFNFDVPGTIIASASVTSQTSLLQVAAAQSIDASKNLYHLVRPELGEGESKIVSEVFLTRLLSTKRILQPYVDDLFHAIFTISRDKPFPKAIKVFFDFLDIQAADLSITDPEVLHIWKTNGLPLRFWVNLIKNPEFIFDINKSATIDACFTVIAQAYIDACSTAEVRYTKDTPSARLLYAKEVRNYKNEVLSYYDGIHSMPRIPNDELTEYFKEMLDPFIEEFEKHEGVSFHIDSAMLELYRSAVQYGEQIAESLAEDRMTMLAAQFNSLRHKFNLDSSPM